MVEKMQTASEIIASDAVPEDYGSALEIIVIKIRNAQARAIKAVNFELISVYRDIGQIIHEKQNQSKWGSSVVERLAIDLRTQFPGIKGLSPRNLWRMKDFYISYQGNEKLTALLAEISWTHHLAILNDTVRLADENPSIGIILCREKNRVIVEYALKDSNKPINIASYKIVKDLPHELKSQLPTIEQIEKLLAHID